jgi:hypothetical protein
MRQDLAVRMMKMAMMIMLNKERMIRSCLLVMKTRMILLTIVSVFTVINVKTAAIFGQENISRQPKVVEFITGPHDCF